MTVGLNNIFGTYEKALIVHERRTELLANNIANQNTPNYKARDIDFRQALQGASDKISQPLALKGSMPGHINTASDSLNMMIKFRTPIAPSENGNTVDSQQETAAFTENSLRYQANLQFIDGKVRSIMSALRGD